MIISKDKEMECEELKFSNWVLFWKFQCEIALHIHISLLSFAENFNNHSNIYLTKESSDPILVENPCFGTFPHNYQINTHFYDQLITS